MSYADLFSEDGSYFQCYARTCWDCHFFNDNYNYVLSLCAAKQMKKESLRLKLDLNQTKAAKLSMSLSNGLGCLTALLQMWSRPKSGWYKSSE